MKYDNIPVLQQNAPYTHTPIGIATIVVEENEGVAKILITTTTPDFVDFLKMGDLRALYLGGQVVNVKPREDPNEV